jgi:hypothetical protein
MDPKQLETLNQNIQQLNQRIERQNSFWRIFVLSILRGVGNFLGFTIVASILIYIASIMLRTINLPLLDDLQNIIETEKIEELN